MPENTIAAMLKAIDLGVTTLEMDAVITKDKNVILSHEPFFNHEITTKPDGAFVTEAEEKNLNIYNMTYEEVVKYDVGMKAHPRFKKQQKIAAVKPLLIDVIDRSEAHAKEIKRAPLFYNIETKSKPSTDNVFHPEPAEFVELLVAVVKEKNIEQRVIIQSFDIRTLQYLHRHYPSIKTALLVEDRVAFTKHIDELGFTPTIYSPEYHLVNSQLVEQCKARGIKIIPWTVNSISAKRKLISLGVDGLITDYP
jgi:glycerophosphoryl diester phosphodiesterase